MNYIEAVSIGFPKAPCHTDGNPEDYSAIVWDSETIIEKDVLDTWILNNQSINTQRILTKYQFRKLFTFQERIAIDNFAANPAIPDQQKAILSTILKDLELSTEVDLDNPDVREGVYFLETIGFIAPNRASEIISNFCK